jgi:hypothetical protein
MQSEPCSFICPCAYGGEMRDTYASVLALGADGVRTALDESVICSRGAVANTSSYCAKCRRITPSLNAARSVQENVMHWRRQHAYFVACAAFIGSWPKLSRGMRQRKRRKKQVVVEASEEG